MIERAVKIKLKVFITLLIIGCMMSQNLGSVLASNGTHVTTDQRANVSANYLTSQRQNLAIMLYDGKNREFDMSIAKAYAQIFRRTQVAWDETQAKATLLLLGPDNYWGANETESGPGGITYTALGDAWGSATYQAHRMGYDPYSLKSRLYKHNLRYGWAWTNETCWKQSFAEDDAYYNPTATDINV